MLGLLLANALILVLAALCLWGVSLKIRDVSFVDSWWPAGMVLVGASSLLLRRALTPTNALLFILVAIWGGRLAIFLFLRWRQKGPDPRYEAMLEDAAKKRGWSFGLGALLLVFALQAPLQLLVALPVQLATLDPPRALQPLALAGAVLSIFGVLFEAIADAQLAAFRKKAAGAGGIMDKGLWRYSRHPNYFGEACFWWGAYLIAATCGLPGIASLPGPLLITFLLTKGSGVPTVEGRMRARGAAFEAYVAKTSSFIPLPPKDLSKGRGPRPAQGQG